MKKKPLITVHLVIISILFLVLATSCKKENEPAVIKDGDGNIYTSVTIGSQIWLNENMKSTKYRNGDQIGTTSDPSTDLGNETNPKYQWAFEGNESNVATYGRLYTWYAVADGRGICPTGWHVPSDAEWSTLVTSQGGEAEAGGKLKEAGTAHWEAPNTGATNESSFNGLPGGRRQYNGDWNYLGRFGIWWSATQSSTESAWIIELYTEYKSSDQGGNNKKNGNSVRCIKD